ncbi:MAG: hypothetical protein C5B59_14575 [Bacteroidetes bacterium]|nr:MAG: hypothetical protein C5B59_14575 [Bacteroidota bacterium]
MSFKKLRRFVLFLVWINGLLLLSRDVNAQAYSTDSQLLKRSVDSNIHFYLASMGTTSHLYNGNEYIYTNHGIQGTPFFGSNQPIIGKICYDGTVYLDVALSYDLSADEVFINNPGQDFSLRLITSKIRYFTILNHTFILFENDGTTKGDVPGYGFYDLLHAGKLTVLAKRMKRVTEAFKTEDAPHYQQYDSYILRKNNTFYNIDSKRQLLDLFDDKKEIMKKFYKKNGFNFKKDREMVLVKMAEYYSQLNE